MAEPSPQSSAQAPSKRGVYAGVLLTAMATLMLEVLLTRLTSVTAWYHLAFFVISLAMLGMTAGAVIVFVWPERFKDEAIATRLAESALGFAVAVPLSVTAMLALPLQPVVDFMAFVALVVVGGILAVPFVLGGVAMTLALTRAGLPTGLVYGVDLIGAASGCALVVPVLDVIDAPSAVILAGAVAALAAFAFARHAGQKGWSAAGLAGLLCVLCIANASQTPAPLRPTWVKGLYEDTSTFSFTGWNTYSRVTARVSVTTEPAYWGRARLTPQSALAPIEQRFIEIDGAAGTVMARLGKSLSDHSYLSWDVTSVAHVLRPTGPAAIIGVGGGRDVLEAARVGHDPVVGIEINDLIVDLHRRVMADFSGLARLPTVRLVNDEARSHLSRSRQRYNVITMSLIDTWASTGAGAYSLSENGLYTVEAWQTFLSRLFPGGIFTVSRWYVVGSPGETARMLVLAFETVRSLGAKQPRDHVVLLQSDKVATLLLSRDPLTDNDINTVQQIAVNKGINMLLTPRKLPAHPMLRALVEQPSHGAMLEFARSQPLDLTPPTDDRPFFFNMLKPGIWLTERDSVNDMDLSFLGNLGATQTLLYATAASLLLTLLTLAYPMARRVGDLRALPRKDVAAALAYFALIGLGFMFVEMAILSRLSVFLGHPTLALAVLLSGIILFTGLGSLLSNRVALGENLFARGYPLVAAALVLLTGTVMGPVMHAFVAAPMGTRVAASVLLMVPPGLGMGLCFPLGLRLTERMEALRTGESRLGPWLWGINGAFSVCASGLGLGCSMVFGIKTTLALGAACYLVLPFATHRLWSSGRGSALLR